MKKYLAYLFPVQQQELKKFIALFLMSFLFTFIYTILRSTKDALIMTVDGGGGAKALPFLTVISILPTIIFALLYAKLSSYLNRIQIYLISICIFLVFFLLFIFILYPNKEFLHSYDNTLLLNFLPTGLSGLAFSIKYWSYTLFYFAEELWASFAISVLFWGLANNINTLPEAKRFYVLYSFAANLGTFLSGYVIKLCLNYFNPIIFSNMNKFDQSIINLVLICFFIGILILMIYLIFLRKIDTYCSSHFIKSDTMKLSLKESISFLFKSRNILFIAILIISCNAVIFNSEIIWKTKLAEAYPDPKVYLHFMSNYSIILSLVSTVIMLFISNQILRRCGWAFAAYVTPVSTVISGALFYIIIIFDNNLTDFISNDTLFGLTITPLMLAVSLGTLHNIISKTTKYALFDATKEMAYIPLDPESKIKGKAIVDSLGTHFGKFISSSLQIVLITISSSLMHALPAISIIMLLIIGFWLWSIYKINDQFITNKNIEKIENDEDVASGMIKL